MVKTVQHYTSLHKFIQVCYRNGRYLERVNLTLMSENLWIALLTPSVSEWPSVGQRSSLNHPRNERLIKEEEFYF